MLFQCSAFYIGPVTNDLSAKPKKNAENVLEYVVKLGHGNV